MLCLTVNSFRFSRKNSYCFHIVLWVIACIFGVLSELPRGDEYLPSLGRRMCCSYVAAVSLVQYIHLCHLSWLTKHFCPKLVPMTLFHVHELNIFPNLPKLSYKQ